MWNRPIAPLAALMILLAGRTALADDAPAGETNAPQTANDEVTLKGGGFVKGTVTRIEPGVEVVIIEVGQTEARTIPWEEVADVQRGAGAGGAAPPATPGYGTAPAPTPVAPTGPKNGVVELHIESEEPVVLYENLGSSSAIGGGYMVFVEHAREVCASPCDSPIDGSRGQMFYVAGDSVPRSKPFRLSGHHGSTDLVVDSGSSAARGGGTAMIIGGSVFLAAGLAGGLVGGVATADTGSFNRDASFLLPLGIGVFVGGAALLTGGIILRKTNGTETELRPGKPAATETAAREPRYWLGEF